MTSLVFLETALNDESSNLLVEENKAAIDYAVAATEQLIVAESAHIETNIGSFLDTELNETYENMQSPIADVVIESAAVFGEIIALDITEAEKIEAIDAAKALIENEEDPMSIFDEEVAADEETE